jgi:thiamine-monophosphate kinase
VNEFERIDHFLQAFDLAPSPEGPGDDCAVLPASRRQVVTCDAVVEGVHFRRRTFSMADVGHKALAVNLSDLAAMAAVPKWFVCALALPDDLGAGELEQLARGMAALARVHGIRLVGGNVTRALQLSVTITAGGEVEQPLLRSGAKPGDLLFVSGPLGDAAAGLEQLDRSPRAKGPLARAQRRPHPHLAFARAAAPFATAAIDLSDGLLQDLGHLATSSKVAAAIDSSAVPVSGALLDWCSPQHALELALTGGEDYGLLVAVSPTEATPFRDTLARVGHSAFLIGSLKRGHGVSVDGKPVRKRSGFMHFR